MKALSLWQPWASLVAIGAKGIDTRGWATRYRGPLAIHAAARKCDTKDIPAPTVHAMIQILRPVTEKLARTAMYLPLELLPRGCVIATCTLAECCRIGEDGLYRLDPDKIEPPTWFAPLPGEPEISFGDYTPGRFAWILEDVRPLPEPIPAKGHQSLWSWEPPEGVLIA